MQRIGYLYNDFCSYQNLYSAYKKAYKGASGKRSTMRYFFNLEDELLMLKKELQTKSYKPGEYKYFSISDPKERIIAAAPFRDRVIHHALVNVLEPIFEKTFIYDSYATRKNKGTHKAVLKAQSFIQKNNWYLKTDISKYFNSINQKVLFNIVQRKIKDKRLLDIIKIIINNGGKDGTGLPIGNLTSQFFANVYLNKLDHFIKEELGVKYYIRYMDDLVMFSNSKTELKLLLKSISYFLNKELKLNLKEKATYINKKMNGLSFLGTRIFPRTIRIKKENLKRSIKKIKEREYQFQKEILSEKKLYECVQSIFAHLSFYNTHNLICSLNIGKLS